MGYMQHSANLLEKFFETTCDERIYFWRGAYSPINFLFSWNRESLYAKVYKTPGLTCFFAISGRDAYMLFSETRYKQYAEEIFSDYWQEGEKKFVCERDAQKVREEVDVLYNKSILEDVQKLSEIEILARIKRVKKLFEDLIVYTIYVEMFDKEMVLSVLKSEERDSIDSIWEKATHPYFETFETRRLRYAASLVEKQEKFRDKLFWFTLTDYFDTGSLKDVHANLQKIADNLRTITRELEEKKKNQISENEVFSNWTQSLSDNQRKLAAYIQQVMKIRDWRKDPIAKIQTLRNVYVRELLRRAGIQPKFSVYIVESDLVDGCTSLRLNRPDIEMREKGFIATLDSRGNVFSKTGATRQIVDLVRKRQMEQEQSFLQSEICGQSGSRGNISGRVHVVKDMKSDHGFLPGEILVTGMTRPEFVPLMKLASAIITDEGGITCHAAIVSRELKKPCIIGTKIATQVLHDGDLVEVDANAGVVRILERAGEGKRKLQ